MGMGGRGGRREKEADLTPLIIGPLSVARITMATGLRSGAVALLEPGPRPFWCLRVPASPWQPGVCCCGTRQGQGEGIQDVTNPGCAKGNKGGGGEMQKVQAVDMFFVGVGARGICGSPGVVVALLGGRPGCCAPSAGRALPGEARGLGSGGQ